MSKIELEKKLEHEQDFFVNHLQKQIDNIEKEREYDSFGSYDVRSALKGKLEDDTNELMKSIQQKIEHLNKASNNGQDDQMGEYTDSVDGRICRGSLQQLSETLLEDLHMIELKLKDLENEKILCMWHHLQVM